MNAVLYLLNVVCASGQSALSKVYALKGGTANVFNVNKAIAGICVFLAMGIYNGMSFHLPTLIFGLCYGIFLGISMFTGFKALEIGPMALTSIIASFSLIIPFIFGITVWNEKLSVLGAVGIVLLLTAIVLLNFKKEKGLSFKWSFFALMILITNGICSLIQKYHQLYYPDRYRIEFMIWSFVCVLFVSTVIGKKELKSFRIDPLGIISGIMNGSANFIVLYLAATQNASVLFPVVSVCNVIAAWLIGRIIFKEKLKLFQLLGLVFGVAAVFMLNF